MKHGGDLSQAKQEFSTCGEGWLDLSTGINPVAYPFTPSSVESWQRLPQSGALAGLIDAARMAYGAAEDVAIVAAPGTQMLIQLLPLLSPAGKVAIVGPTYSEHALRWQAAGAEIAMIDDLACLAPSPGAPRRPLPRRGEGKHAASFPLVSPLPRRERAECDSIPGEGEMPPFVDVANECNVVVAVNPNNPDGRSWTPEQVCNCADEMAGRGGLLIVDEAFADVQPEVSAVPYAGREGLVVLRSFGKFFGLAGVRLGFALGPQGLITQITDLLGPWAVSGPAIEIGMQALRDTDWQSRARKTCADMAAKLDALLADAGFDIIGGTPLFRLVHHVRALDIHRDLARQGIWVRRFDEYPCWLRFGLPSGDGEFRRLAAAF